MSPGIGGCFGLGVDPGSSFLLSLFPLSLLLELGLEVLCTQANTDSAATTPALAGNKDGLSVSRQSSKTRSRQERCEIDGTDGKQIGHGTTGGKETSG